MKTNLLKQMRSKVIAIVGPTASGKTAYAIELAKKIDGEIISADSRYVYRELNIGTAKPTIEEMSVIPHHLIDIVNPDFDYSVGLFVKDAKKCIDEIINRGKIPIVAGGTGLYFTALFENYLLPEAEPDWKLREELDKFSSEDLWEILLELDCNAPELINLDKNDKKKIIRTIEILKLTGKKMEDIRTKGECPYDVEWIGLNFEREELYNRINLRTDEMINSGLVEETKNLINKWGRLHNITDTIGYREITEYLDGEISLNQAVDKIKQNSRRYAKRQLTWFRRNPQIKWNIYPHALAK